MTQGTTSRLRRIAREEIGGAGAADAPRATASGPSLLLWRLLVAIAVMQAVTLLALGLLVVENAQTFASPHATATALHPGIAIAKLPTPRP